MSNGGQASQSMIEKHDQKVREDEGFHLQENMFRKRKLRENL
jgi:hypothetical protein